MPDIIPTFLLSTERSGSTLLRRAFNTHPEIWCPDEIGLGVLLDSLLNVIEAGSERESYSSFEDNIFVTPLPTEEACRRARVVIDDLMQAYTRQRGKSVWCEKSPVNCNHLTQIRTAFPDGRFVCLYRHCLDMVDSCLRACQQGFGVSDLARHATQNPTNLVAAMATAWLEKTTAVLMHEAERGGQCHRVKYEELVTAPEDTLTRIFHFLGLNMPPHLVTEIFSVEHHQRQGHGDENARYATRFQTDKLGQGARLRWPERLSGDLLKRVNLALEMIGYPKLDPRQRQYSVGVSPRPSPATAEDTNTAGLWDLLRERVSDNSRWPEPLRGTVRLQVTGPGGGDWYLELGPESNGVQAAGSSPYSLTIASTDLWAIMQGRLNPYQAAKDGKIVVAGNPETDFMARLAKLLGGKELTRIEP